MVTSERWRKGFTSKLMKSFLVIISLTLISPVWLAISVSSLRYALAIIFQALAFVTFILFFSETKIRIRSDIDYKRLIDYFLIMCSLLLLMLDLTGSSMSYIKLVLSIIVTSYLPGWVFIRFTSIFHDAKGMENLVLPFVLSIPLSSLIFSVFIFAQYVDKRLFLLTYVAMSFLAAVKVKIKHKNYSPNETSLRLSLILVLIWLLAFFSFEILGIYPNMAILRDQDIVRHFSRTQLLISTPSSMVDPELWFHTHWASVYILSRPSTQIFQTALAFLTIFSIFSFYLMSKRYLQEIDQVLPALATLLWAVFAGFGWLYFLQVRIGNQTSSALYDLVWEAWDKSYWDVGFGQGLTWLWYRPATLGLTLLFVLLYLLKKNRLDKRSFMLVIGLLLVALNFIHFPTSFMFVSFLLPLSLFKPTKLRVKEAAASSAMAMLVSLPLLLAYQAIGIQVQIPLGHLILLTTVSFSCILLSRFKVVAKSWTAAEQLLSGLLFIYMGLLVVWLITADSFSVEFVGRTLSVPWQFYPMLLGIAGLFGILSINMVLKRYRKNSVAFFPLLLFFAILFGRLLTYYNFNVELAGYWERRIVPIAYAAACVLAPLFIMDIFSRIKRKIVLSAMFIVLMVVFGTMSTSLTLEVQFWRTSQYHLDDRELETVNMLNELDADKVFLTVTDPSRRLAEFAPSNWLIDKYRSQIWAAKYPELPLGVLYSMNKSVFIFLQEADVQEINRKYALGYLASHLIPLTSNGSENNVGVILLPRMVAPSPNSEAVLVMPDYPDSSIWYAVDMLSQANCNYSTALIEDINIISKAKTLIAPTESIALQLIRYRELFDLRFDNLIVLNSNGYGDLALNYFSNPKMTLSIGEDSKKIGTLIVGGTSVNNLTRILAPLEFQVSSIYNDGSFFTLLDDNLYGWTVYGSGSGNISCPQLALNDLIKTTGNSSIQVNVTSGKFAQWHLAKIFPDRIDAENFDFISFYWYGNSDRKGYVLDFSDSLNHYWYLFEDSWNGWKKVLIPIRIPDGRYDMNGVYFAKVTTGKPEWNNIRRLEIRSANQTNLPCKFLIDRFGFESADTVHINLATYDRASAFKLSNYNGTGWIPIGEPTSNETILVSNYALMNGLNCKMVFGKGSFLNISMTKALDSSKLTISVKLPPNIGNAEFCSIKLRVVPVTPYVQADEITGLNTSLQLKTKINAFFLETDNDVIAWYKNARESILFAIKDYTNGFETIYVNVYPLIADLNHSKNNYGLLGRIPYISTWPVGQAQTKAENPVQGELVTFSRIDFEGNGTVYCHSSVIFKEMNTTLTLILPNMEMTDLSKIVVTGDEIVLKAKYGSLLNGRGFYSNIYSNDLLVNSNGGMLGTILLEFNNRTQRMISGPVQNIHISGSSMAVIRQPTLQIEGKVIFHKLYTYALLERLGIFEEDASLQGRLAFTVVFGDEFTVANNFTYVGRIVKEDKYRYDEMKTLLQSLPIFLVTALLFLTAYVYTLLVKRRELNGASAYSW